MDVAGVAHSGNITTIADIARVRALLIAAAREGRGVSYSEVLGALGLRFSRPKMRALCKTLDRIDAEAAANGEPELAVLVVRESDRLPGKGWWVSAAAAGYPGAWNGIQADKHVDASQRSAMLHWRHNP